MTKIDLLNLKMKEGELLFDFLGYLNYADMLQKGIAPKTRNAEEMEARFKEDQKHHFEKQLIGRRN